MAAPVVNIVFAIIALIIAIYQIFSPWAWIGWGLSGGFYTNDIFLMILSIILLIANIVALVASIIGGVCGVIFFIFFCLNKPNPKFPLIHFICCIIILIVQIICLIVAIVVFIIALVNKRGIHTGFVGNIIAVIIAIIVCILIFFNKKFNSNSGISSEGGAAAE
mmetsp:Transcript_3056/g.4488  ORF Transcript_3056/g.4488 Transcript_3056/m.4488 type:complete len:164 (-) Transcript_3056:87-578(-)